MNPSGLNEPVQQIDCQLMSIDRVLRHVAWLERRSDATLKQPAGRLLGSRVDQGETPILAEVADKEPTITVIWCVAALLCIGGFLLGRWRRFAGVIVLPLAALWAWTLVSELHGPYVGPAG